MIELIDVGDQHVLPAAAGAADDAVARLDAFDDAFVRAFGSEPDDVAGRDDMPLIGRQRFEQPPRRALKMIASLIADDAMQTLHAQDAAEPADCAIDLEKHHRAGLVFDDFGAGDGSLARDIAFAADPFAVRGVVAARRCHPRSIGERCLIAARTLAVLAEVGANLAFLGGHKGSWAGDGATDYSDPRATRQSAVDSLTLDLRRLHRVIGQLNLARTCMSCHVVPLAVGDCDAQVSR